MSDSILTSTKKNLGVAASDTAFDLDIITHINSALATLTQLGVGPQAGFMIEDAGPTWEDFIGVNPVLNPAKTYVYLRVRLIFDPPQTSYLATSLQEQVKELEWRLEIARLPILPVDPPVLVEPYVVYVLDGGGEVEE